MLLNRETILKWAQRYDKNTKASDKEVEARMKELLKKQRFLRKHDLIEIGCWKSPRQKRRYANNDDITVKEITQFSFAAKSEYARIGVLLALDGVFYPVASVLLHFAFPDKYPILDFRTLYSLGEEKPTSYNFEFWNSYCKKIQQLARELNLSIRTIDKALWQYSKENQK